tara:strand:- start:9926 stop:10630 length:705 start_codon:yes stop_codon:yes gene_type:complete
MKNSIHNKDKLVNSVFSKVYKKYDLMNDIMSLGIHRIWKKKLLEWMNPQPGQSLVDVASGTGDIAKLFLKKNNNNCDVACVEPNKEMFKIGKSNLKNFKNVNWLMSPAEELPLKDNSFDFYTISYGLRNVNDINLSLKEALRVLKPGGRFMCLEFSKIDNEIFDLIYRQYSKAIPFVGKYIVGSSKPYDYLIKSIEEFYNQEQLVDLMKYNGFSNIKFRNLSNGISAIHSGWKI